MLLFIILFLHQTTTEFDGLGYQAGCLSSCSYIKPQQKKRIMIVKSVVYHLVPTSNHNGSVCFWQVWSLFIILFLHQTTTYYLGSSVVLGCLSSCSYIKPQHHAPGYFNLSRCLSSCSYIKPQHESLTPQCIQSCLSSCSYIKPQQRTWCNHWYLVVYHLVPTSNHNKRSKFRLSKLLFIILFLHQTTTIGVSTLIPNLLFIILFLHQTTTGRQEGERRRKLFIILFLHQTTTYSRKSTDNQ